MRIVIVPQKMSGTGSIHDIASQHSDREIKFPKGSEFAVVLADYYGGKGYTTHKSELATVQADRRNSDYSRQIVGVDGNTYHVEYDMLVKDYGEPYEVQER